MEFILLFLKSFNQIIIPLVIFPDHHKIDINCLKINLFAILLKL